MSDFDGNFMEMTSYWAPPSSPSPRTILAMLEQTDDGLNPITEIFPQTNLRRDHTNQSEQRSGLGERFGARLGHSLPTLDIETINPLATLFRTSTVPSPGGATSPGFSPTSLLQSPNIVTNSSQIIPPSSAPNYGPPEMVQETYGEGNAMTMMFNNELPYQQVNVDLPPLEGFDDIPTEESSVYIPSYETHVEPIGAPLVPSFEFELADNANVNIIHIEDSESEDEEDFEDEEDDEDDEEEVDHDDIVEVDDDAEPSSPKRRRFEVSNMIGATRSSKTERNIIRMESDEDNPSDGFRWRKYGQKVVKGNPNPRSYYKCTNSECNVKKHVERGADNVKLVVCTYDGKHNHAPPPARGRCISVSRNRSGTTTSQNHSNRTGQFGMSLPPPSSVTPMEMNPFSSFTPPIDLTRVYMTGLSKLPTVPFYQNPGFMTRNDEPRMNVVPDGCGVYGGIMNRLFTKFGVNL